MSVEKIPLGATVTDPLAQITGVVMGRSSFLTGCDHLAVLPQVKKPDGVKSPEWIWADEARWVWDKKTPLVVLKSPEEMLRDPGGPAPHPNKH